MTGDRQSTSGDENGNAVDCLHVSQLEAWLAQGSKFTSEAEAEAFYYSYVRRKGFGIRKDVKLYEKAGKSKYMRWVCSREGFRPHKYVHNLNRKKAPRAITRTGCKAEFRIVLNRKSGGLISTYFAGDHNYELTPPEHVH